MRKNILLVIFFLTFLFLGLMAFKDAMPSNKNERVYKILQEYLPYILEKRVGGYSIVSKQTGIKEKPPAKTIFLRLEQLEKEWGKKFLKLEKNSLIILDKDNKEIKKIVFKTQEEKDWVKGYFNLK